MQPIVSTVGKRLPLIGPVISSVSLALDVKEILENSTTYFFKLVSPPQTNISRLL